MPQHLFGDPRASMELSNKQPDPATEQANKQATAVLNRFLQDFSKMKEPWSRTGETGGE